VEKAFIRSGGKRICRRRRHTRHQHLKPPAFQEKEERGKNYEGRRFSQKKNPCHIVVEEKTASLTFCTMTE